MLRGETSIVPKVFDFPTEAEQEFILRGRGAAQGRYHFGDDEGELEKYAWYRANSNRETHQVKKRLPLIVDGKALHDLHGNVWEWSWDKYWDIPRGGVNPVSASKNIPWAYRAVRSGGWNDSEAPDLRSANRKYIHPDRQKIDTGFRLVRTSRAP